LVIGADKQVRRMNGLQVLEGTAAREFIQNRASELVQYYSRLNPNPTPEQMQGYHHIAKQQAVIDRWAEEGMEAYYDDSGELVVVTPDGNPPPWYKVSDTAPQKSTD
jgi:hypothetical protein